jgi:hypothetical protein
MAVVRELYKRGSTRRRDIRPGPEVLFCRDPPLRAEHRELHAGRDEFGLRREGVVQGLDRHARQFRDVDHPGAGVALFDEHLDGGGDDPLAGGQRLLTAGRNTSGLDRSHQKIETISLTP